MKPNEYLQRHMMRVAEWQKQRVTNPPEPAPKPAPTKLDYEKIVCDWWNSLAPAARNHPWSIETIAAAAFNGQPHAPALRCIAKVLRDALRFSERRDYRNVGRNRRYWLPPSNK